jgi:hypothetical protein
LEKISTDSSSRSLNTKIKIHHPGVQQKTTNRPTDGTKKSSGLIKSNGLREFEIRNKKYF